MLSLTHLVLLCLMTIRTVRPFNIENRNPIMKKGAQNTYFGFSVAEHWIESAPGRLSNSWILVGAPLGQNLQPNTNHSGALFKCPVTSKQDDCEQVRTDGRRVEEDYDDDDTNADDMDVLQPPGNDEIKNGQWLGVTVRSQKPGGRVMTCAHRYIQSPNLTTHRYGMGLCYILNNQLQLQEHLQPCMNLKKDKLHEQFGFCQVGTSLAILKDNYALLGTPGPFTWRGTIFAKPTESNVTSDINYKMGPLNDDSEPIDKYSYLGMSVAGGTFFRKKILTYASGAPRSKLTGQVYFLERINRQDVMNITCVISGEQFASSFGYEIMALDVDHDGFDDLLVGAPFYFKSGVGGAVYVYTKLRECCKTRCKPSQNFTGLTESRFGFAMTSLGDINKDGWVDVAIGAPYEAGGGAVYIYLGSRNGLNPKPAQVLKGKDIQTHGYSLSGGLDMDDNGYPDLLVGAYDVAKVFLYKTRPIIDINIAIEDDDLKNIDTTSRDCAQNINRPNSACYTFKTCFTLSGFPTNKKTLKVKYEIKDISQKFSRISFYDPDFPDKRQSHKSGYAEMDKTSRNRCDEHTFSIPVSVTDILTPIKFIVNYTLDNDEENSPILNKTSVKEFQATFQKNCGSDDICESNLVLQAAPQLNKTEQNDSYNLDLGQNQEFILEANVSNSGESAYEAKLVVLHPEALSYIALQIDKGKTSKVVCEYKNDTLVVCNLGNPFQHQEHANLKLRFEVKSTKQHILKITMFVNSTSRELSDRTSSGFGLVLHKIAQYSIRQSSPYTPNVVYAGEVKGQSAMHFLEDIGARVNHTYQISNEGMWNIQDVMVRILWPYQVFSKRSQGGKWLLYLEQSPEIEAADTKGISCWVKPPNLVNPLNLKSSGIEVNEPANFTMPEKVTRRKRDLDDVIQPEIKPGQDGKPRNIVTMDCQKQTSKCAEIVCNIKSLRKNDPVKIKIRSRIWNSTLVEDYSKVDGVIIRSVAEVIMIDKSVISSNASIPATGIETLALPEVVLAEGSLNIWIIVGAVLAGLLLLIILIYILYRFGFFKRNRIKDQTLSGNLKKQGENEVLLNRNEPKPT